MLNVRKNIYQPDKGNSEIVRKKKTKRTNNSFTQSVREFATSAEIRKNSAFNITEKDFTIKMLGCKCKSGLARRNTVF